jgi:hypothetical protein
MAKWLATLAVIAVMLAGLAGPAVAAGSTAMTWNEFGAFFRAETDPDECSATGRTVVSITHKVVNDEDSGVAGNYWAFDSYSRLLTIVEVVAPTSPGGPGKYCAVTQYFGNFVTRAGASPNNTCALAAGVKGQYRGGYRTTIFDGALNLSPSQKITGNLGIFDYQCDGLGNCPGVFSWPSTYFLQVANLDLDWWGWMYYGYANGSWINSSDGNSGDICSP